MAGGRTSFGSWCARIERGQKRLNDVLIASFCYVFLLSGTSKYFVGSGLLLKAVKVCFCVWQIIYSEVVAFPQMPS